MKYCLRCGNIVSDLSCYKNDKYCASCGNKFVRDNMTGEMFEKLSDDEKQQYTDKLCDIIKHSDVFDQSFDTLDSPFMYMAYWFDKFEELIDFMPAARYDTHGEMHSDRDKEEIQKREQSKNRESENTPKCPTCSSTNIRKISTTAKAANTVLFGIFGTKRHKTFHCSNCSYEW